MGDSGSGRAKRRAQSEGPSAAVLTPPTGIPTFDDLTSSVGPAAQVVPEVALPEVPEIAFPAPRPSGENVAKDVPEGPVVPPKAAAPATLCVCGHEAAAHEHYRRGDDCGACGPEICGHYRPQGGRKRWFRRH